MTHCVNMFISHIKQHVQHTSWVFLTVKLDFKNVISISHREKNKTVKQQQHNFSGIVKVNTNKSQLIKY